MTPSFMLYSKSKGEMAHFGTHLLLIFCLSCLFVTVAAGILRFRQPSHRIILCKHQILVSKALVHIIVT